MWCTNILGSTGSGSRLSNYCGGGKETVELNYKKVTVIRVPGYDSEAIRQWMLLSKSLGPANQPHFQKQAVINAIVVKMQLTNTTTHCVQNALQ